MRLSCAAVVAAVSAAVSCSAFRSGSSIVESGRMKVTLNSGIGSGSNGGREPNDSTELTEALTSAKSISYLDSLNGQGAQQEAAGATSYLDGLSGGTDSNNRDSGTFLSSVPQSGNSYLGSLSSSLSSAGFMFPAVDGSESVGNPIVQEEQSQGRSLPQSGEFYVVKSEKAPLASDFAALKKAAASPPVQKPLFTVTERISRASRKREEGSSLSYLEAISRDTKAGRRSSNGMGVSKGSYLDTITKTAKGSTKVGNYVVGGKNMQNDSGGKTRNAVVAGINVGIGIGVAASYLADESNGFSVNKYLPDATSLNKAYQERFSVLQDEIVHLGDSMFEAAQSERDGLATVKSNLKWADPMLKAAQNEEEKLADMTSNFKPPSFSVPPVVIDSAYGALEAVKNTASDMQTVLRRSQGMMHTIDAQQNNRFPDSQSRQAMVAPNSDTMQPVTPTEQSSQSTLEGMGYSKASEEVALNVLSAEVRTESSAGDAASISEMPPASGALESASGLSVEGVSAPFYDASAVQVPLISDSVEMYESEGSERMPDFPSFGDSQVPLQSTNVDVFSPQLTDTVDSFSTMQTAEEFTALSMNGALQDGQPSVIAQPLSPPFVDTAAPPTGAEMFLPEVSDVGNSFGTATPEDFNAEASVEVGAAFRQDPSALSPGESLAPFLPLEADESKQDTYPSLTAADDATLFSQPANADIIIPMDSYDGGFNPEMNSAVDGSAALSTWDEMKGMLEGSETANGAQENMMDNGVGQAFFPIHESQPMQTLEDASASQILGNADLSEGMGYANVEYGQQEELSHSSSPPETQFSQPADVASFNPETADSFMTTFTEQGLVTEIGETGAAISGQDNPMVENVADWQMPEPSSVQTFEAVESVDGMRFAENDPKSFMTTFTEQGLVTEVGETEAASSGQDNPMVERVADLQIPEASSVQTFEAVASADGMRFAENELNGGEVQYVPSPSVDVSPPSSTADSFSQSIYDPVVASEETFYGNGFSADGAGVAAPPYLDESLSTQPPAEVIGNSQDIQATHELQGMEREIEQQNMEASIDISSQEIVSNQDSTVSTFMDAPMGQAPVGQMATIGEMTEMFAQEVEGNEDTTAETNAWDNSGMEQLGSNSQQNPSIDSAGFGNTPAFVANREVMNGEINSAMEVSSENALSPASFGFGYGQGPEYVERVGEEALVEHSVNAPMEVVKTNKPFCAASMEDSFL